MQRARQQQMRRGTDGVPPGIHPSGSPAGQGGAGRWWLGEPAQTWQPPP